MSPVPDNPSSRKPNPQRDAAFRLVAILVALIVFLTGALIWALTKSKAAGPARAGKLQVSGIDHNYMRETYPHVDFGPLYPNLTGEEIDRLQRESFSVQYIYEPYVQFRALPVKTKYVTVTEDGRRERAIPQPWPPQPDGLTIFTFGGSTTFGHNLPPEETIPALIEKELRPLYAGTNVVVYNFACAYYYSSQERALFNSLLERGIRPDMAIFIDGLNDFWNAREYPAYTRTLRHYTSPDIPFPNDPVFETEEDIRGATEYVIGRYQHNVRLIMGAAQMFGVHAIFAGQPVPHWGYARTPANYPFEARLPARELAHFGYEHFAGAAINGQFGPNFVWVGDVFQNQSGPMYSDAVHYSSAGARLVAKAIVNRADTAGLLPGRPRR